MDYSNKATSSFKPASRRVRLAHLVPDASGFSLIEVLVSIVILSFGLLGMVGMQAAALQSNREARLQSTAIVLARELAEMMRGNKEIGIKKTASTNPYLGSFTSPLTAATPTYCLSVGTTACSTTTAVANAQMTEWLARVDAQLPGARVEVCFDSAPFDSTSGLPEKWTHLCDNAGTAVVKIGWTRGSTDRSKSGSDALERTTDEGNARPLIVVPLTAGSST